MKMRIKKLVIIVVKKLVNCINVHLDEENEMWYVWHVFCWSINEIEKYFFLLSSHRLSVCLWKIKTKRRKNLVSLLYLTSLKCHAINNIMQINQLLSLSSFHNVRYISKQNNDKFIGIFFIRFCEGMISFVPVLIFTAVFLSSIIYLFEFFFRILYACLPTLWTFLLYIWIQTIDAHLQSTRIQWRKKKNWNRIPYLRRP